jgi:hypothetical protein
MVYGPPATAEFNRPPALLRLTEDTVSPLTKPTAEYPAVALTAKPLSYRTPAPVVSLP